MQSLNTNATSGSGLKRESSFRAALSRVSPRMALTAAARDAVVGGSLVPPVFKPIHPDQEQLCRQQVRPQCSLSLKFNVTPDRPRVDLKWSLRVNRGTLLFLVYRRPMEEQVACRSKVCEYAISSSNSPMPRDKGNT